MSVTGSAYSRPSRSPAGFGIERVRPVPGGAELLCDCGVATDLMLEIDPGVIGTTELAFTCDGCLSVHWFYIRISEPAHANAGD